MPLQALAMLNDAFVAEQAIHFAGRVKRLAGAPREDAIRTAFRLALVRSPSSAEVDICSRLLERQAGQFSGRRNHRPRSPSTRCASSCVTRSLIPANSSTWNEVAHASVSHLLAESFFCRMLLWDSSGTLAPAHLLHADRLLGTASAIPAAMT